MSDERVFLGIQFPMVDLRPLIEGVERLSAPTWPSPAIGQEFIRSCGVVRARPKGQPLSVLGEAGFVSVNGMLPAEKKAPPGAPRTSRLLYARIYGTEVGYRFDVGVKMAA